MTRPIQIDPPLWLETPLGPGWAHFYKDNGPGAETYWTVFLGSGAIVIFPNEKVRATNTYTGDRWNRGITKAMTTGGTEADQDMREITAAPKKL